MLSSLVLVVTSSVLVGSLKKKKVNGKVACVLFSLVLVVTSSVLVGS